MMATSLRAPTLASHAELLAWAVDGLVVALRTGDLDEIEQLLDEVRSFRPPHGVDPMTALVVVLAAQIDPSVPVDVRTGWVREFDPAVTGAA